MSTNSTDHKFGLPKPDFQAFPKKKGIWPLLIIVAIVFILIVGKVGYSFYCRMVEGPTPSVEPATHTETENEKNANSTIHTSVGDSKAFKHKKSNNVKKSISATQRQLAAKQKKPLIQPGTFQELKEPQGIYHLVVSSHLKKKSAMEVVHQLMKKNLGVYLIVPRIDKGEKYYRVTIGHSKTEDEADGWLEHFTPSYQNLFILKY